MIAIYWENMKVDDKLADIFIQLELDMQAASSDARRAVVYIPHACCIMCHEQTEGLGAHLEMPLVPAQYSQFDLREDVVLMWSVQLRTSFVL